MKLDINEEKKENRGNNTCLIVKDDIKVFLSYTWFYVLLKYYLSFYYFLN